MIFLHGIIFANSQVRGQFPQFKHASFCSGPIQEHSQMKEGCKFLGNPRKKEKKNRLADQHFCPVSSRDDFGENGRAEKTVNLELSEVEICEHLFPTKKQHVNRNFDMGIRRKNVHKSQKQLKR